MRVDRANPITFNGIGGLHPGQPVDELDGLGFDVPAEGDIDRESACRSARHRIYDGIHLLIGGASFEESKVSAVYFTDQSFTTSSGMRVGSSLADLQNQYGDRLGVFRLGEAQEATIDGHPVAVAYTDLAVVLDRSTGMTFYLDEEDRVREIKISDFDFLGDDEGCA